jgi:hypothetical protein
MYYIGLDLGQKHDFTAIAIVERPDHRIAWMPPPAGLTVRHLERMPLGTPYPRVVERVCAIVRNPKLGGDCRLVVDSTGIGVPVVDLLRAAGLSGRLTAVTITGGESARGNGEVWSVPRKDLLAGLEVLLDASEIQISRTLSETATLVKELTSLRTSGHSTGHDDLVLAVALACWRARWKTIGFGTQRLPGI